MPLTVNGVTWQLCCDVISPFSTRGTFDIPTTKVSYNLSPLHSDWMDVLVPMTTVPITLLAPTLEQDLRPSPPLKVK